MGRISHGWVDKPDGSVGQSESPLHLRREGETSAHVDSVVVALMVVDGHVRGCGQWTVATRASTCAMYQRPR